ncbi:DUF983 domain-containing protein [Aureivirga sp. CE67]|uniref:DUF983 domain-containing protein n=1 Tax=Aureivirga sp. CE67 TaxID=1788983 RepID=UPI0018C90563|nr:DUF983 domain-containing protein [Aureivirga sp. CE67]
MKKGSIFYSIFKNKCPRCQEGDFFAYNLTLNPKKILKTNDTCSNCGLKYMIEPSFFYGAMYVNYGLTVAIGVAAFVIGKFMVDLTLLQCFYAIVVALVVSMPLNLRLSRLIWINIFVKYNPTRRGPKK